MATIFFAKFPAEQTPQLFLLSDQINRKKTQIQSIADHVRFFIFNGFFSQWIQPTDHAGHLVCMYLNALDEASHGLSSMTGLLVKIFIYSLVRNIVKKEKRRRRFHSQNTRSIK